jgi:hypothetical protein
MESLLSQEPWQGFLEGAMSLDDALTLGQLEDASSYQLWALSAASRIAGQEAKSIYPIFGQSLPPTLKTALEAIGTGLILAKDVR